MNRDAEFQVFEEKLREDIASTVEAYLRTTPEWSSWTVLKLIRGK